MALYEVEFTSANGRDTIYGWIHGPVREARGIVHVIHGLGEHSRRYLPLIDRLLDAGFAVVAGDHAGHGRTAMRSGIWGDAGEDADAVVVDDERTLGRLAGERFPDLPVVVFGHSWGSMIARDLLSGSTDVAGLVLGGVAAQMHGLEQLLDRAALRDEPDPEAPADESYLAALFDGFLTRYGPDAGPTDWVAKDPEVVRDHAIDPLNNFGAPLSNRFLRGFVELYDRVNADSWYPTIRPDLPVLVLAGSEDPVANFGEGAFHVGNALVASGHGDVRVKVYSGYRHEVHNEPQTRDDVAAEIIAFAERVLGGDRTS